MKFVMANSTECNSVKYTHRIIPSVFWEDLKKLKERANVHIRYILVPYIYIMQ